MFKQSYWLNFKMSKSANVPHQSQRKHLKYYIDELKYRSLILFNDRQNTRTESSNTKLPWGPKRMKVEVN